MERFFEFLPYGRHYPDIHFTSGSTIQQAWEVNRLGFRGGCWV